jgi:hypothetical protein
MGDYLMSLIKANNITNTTGGIPTVKGQKLIPTAWVNFNGTGTVAIRDSENVSSITDNGTGHYSINFSVAMANTNYAGVLFTNAVNGTSAGAFNNQHTGGFWPTSTSLCTMYAYGVASVDASLNCVTIMGGQA